MHKAPPPDALVYTGSADIYAHVSAGICADMSTDISADMFADISADSKLT